MRKLQQINNNYADYYYLTEEGTIYNSKTNKYIKPCSNNLFKLKTIEGNYVKISLKKLYKLVFNKCYVIDNIEDLSGEHWKPIERTDNCYYVSDKGRIKSYKGYQAIILKTYLTNGYERVDIVVDGERSSKLVSRLVAAAFLEQPKSIDMQLHHKSGCKTENNKNNLVWLTPAEHRAEHKRMKEKEQQANA